MSSTQPRPDAASDAPRAATAPLRFEVTLLPVADPDPEQGSYRTFASFADPDGNRWLLQQITERLPGRE